MAGVTRGGITKACSGILKDALNGDRIDTKHPDAEEYLEEKTATPPPEPATGIDPLYEKAIEQCHANGRYTATNIQRQLKVGYARAKRILDMIKLAGVVPAPGAISPTTQAADPVLMGGAAKNHSKKAAALRKLMEEGDTLHEIPEDIRAFADMTLRELIQRYGTDTAFLDWLNATKRIEDINEKRLKNAATKGELVSRQAVKVGIIDPIDAAHIKLLTDGAKTIARRVTAMHDAGRPLGDVEKFVKDQITSFIRPVKAKVARALKNA